MVVVVGRGGGCGALVVVMMKAGRRTLSSSAAARATATTGKRATTIVDYGPGCIDQFARKHAAAIGAKALVVCGGGLSAEAMHPQRVESLLRSAGVDCGRWSMPSKYPTPEAVDAAVAMARRIGAQSIVAVGGGGVIDMAKVVGTVSCEVGAGSSSLCRNFLRVNYKEREMKGETLPVIAIPTSASVGAGLSPQALVLYDPEECLVPINTDDVSPAVAVVDPHLCRTVPPEYEGSMALATLSVLMDALLGHGVPPPVRGLAKEGCRAIAEGMGGGGNDRNKRLEHLCKGSILAGQMMASWGPTAVPPIQHVTRCVAPLFPKTSYTSIATALLHSYLQAVQEGLVVVNEGLLEEMATCVGVGGAKQLVEWVGRKRADTKAMVVLSSEGREERTAAAVAEQVSNVLELFEVDRESPALDLHVLHHVLARVILDKQ